MYSEQLLWAVQRKFSTLIIIPIKWIINSLNKVNLIARITLIQTCIIGTPNYLPYNNYCLLLSTVSVVLGQDIDRIMSNDSSSPSWLSCPHLTESPPPTSHNKPHQHYLLSLNSWRTTLAENPLSIDCVCTLRIFIPIQLSVQRISLLHYTYIPTGSAAVSVANTIAKIA